MGLRAASLSRVVLRRRPRSATWRCWAAPRTTPSACGCPGWPGARCRWAPPRRCWTTSSPTSTSARRSASRSATGRAWRSWSPTSASSSNGMRLVTYRAASRAAQGQTFAREVALARRLCAEKGMQIGNDGVQLLGGHGFVKEHPVERWYRDLRADRRLDGRPRPRPTGDVDDQPRDAQEVPPADRARPTRSRRTCCAPTRASTTSPSTSTPRSSTCSRR